MLTVLGPKAGESIDLIIDDSKKEKRGKKMDAGGWTFDPVCGRKIKGYQYVTAILSFRGFRFPFAIRLYAKKEVCGKLGIEFTTAIDHATEMIGSLVPPEGVKVRVLFDSWYLCGKVVKAFHSKGFSFISALKKNRNLFKNGRKLKAGKYGKNLLRKSKVRTFRKSKNVQYQYVDCGKLNVGKLGKLHVIFSRKLSDKDVKGTVSSDPKLSASGILKAYGGRWPIEVFFKESKQLLGLGQYQNARYSAAVTHLHLVCFAYALLTPLAIEDQGAQGKKRKRKPADSRFAADLQNELRRIVWDDLSKHLKEGVTWGPNELRDETFDTILSRVGGSGC